MPFLPSRRDPQISLDLLDEKREQMQEYADAKTLEHEQDGTLGQHHPLRRIVRRIRGALGTEDRG